jgi:ssRNA-specific RNase YbeY (16S rRNA maturation enzyme)
VVHLSGYTHDSEPDAMEMNRRVEEVFQRLAQ